MYDIHNVCDVARVHSTCHNIYIHSHVKERGAYFTFALYFNRVVKFFLMLRLKFYIKRLNFFKQNVKIFSKKILSGNFSELSRISKKKSVGKISGIFRKIVGNFFVRRPVRKPPKSPPGLFRKTGELFIRIRFGNVCFPHKFRGEI